MCKDKNNFLNKTNFLLKIDKKILKKEYLNKNVFSALPAKSGR